MDRHTVNPTKIVEEDRHEIRHADEAEGKWHQVKGKVKEIAGDLSGDPKLKAEGKKEGRGGEIQEKTGEIKTIVRK